MMIRRIASLLLLTLFAAHAQFSLPFGNDTAPATPKTQAAFHSENRSIAPGKPFTVLLELKHPKGWHSYFVNPGNVGEVPRIDWKLPPGFTAGPIQWPVPHLSESLGMKSYTYDGTIRFPVEITPAKDLTTDRIVEIEAKATWQICSDSGCIPEDKAFRISLPVATTAEIDAAKTKPFEEARAALPLQSKDWSVSASAEGATLILKFKPESATAKATGNLYIFNSDGQLDAETAQSVSWKDGMAEVRINRAKDSKPLSTFSGIAFSENGWVAGMPQTGLLIDSVKIGMEPAKPLPAGQLLGILYGMLLGGLILNLMPCVFPVIGLKILGFVQHAGDDRRKVALHGVLFSLGVFVSFAVLSGVLIAVRNGVLHAAGGNLGWGYQLQNPWFVMTMMLLMFVFALNMAGIFEIGTSATSVGGKITRRHDMLGSFFSGVLATIVATPCSAPFLAPAIGTAIGLPAAQFFAAFAAMALGLTLPYLVLSIFPKLTDMLPRPGAWMESFKQGMSFLLFGTAGYLLWVYIGQIAHENSLNPLLGLAVIALGLWIYGRWHLPYKKRRVRAIACVIALATLITGIVLVKPPQPSTLHWETWSQARVDELLEEGKPVYVDFTAAWCLTCQVNKKTAYSKAVIDEIHQRGIVLLKADKTKPDLAIDAKIQEFGRAAIPVNVLYVPGKPPIVTKEILTPDYLLELFRKEVPAARVDG